MSGLLRRIRRTGAAAGEGDPQPTGVDSPPETDRPAVPAGVDPAELESRPSTRRRGVLRRRARYLRRARELMLRDLGGLVYESRRREQPVPDALVASKAERLAAVDAELRELDEHLGSPRSETVLREPGVGGSCQACGELHPSDARFCANCGAELTARTAETPAPEPAPEAPTREEPAAEAEAPTREEPVAGNGRHAAEPVPTAERGS